MAVSILLGGVCAPGGLALTEKLTPEAFERLLAELDPDRDRAGEVYEAIRQRLLRFFEWRGAAFPEELTDETIDRVARRIRDGAEIWTASPFPFFLGVGRKVFSEYVRRRPEVAMEPQPGPGPLEALERLDLAMRELAPDDYELISGYYGGSTPKETKQLRNSLARRFGISANGLRIRACRIRVKLERYFSSPPG